MFSTMLRRMLLLVLSCTVAMVLLAACGGDDDDGDEDARPASTASQSDDSNGGDDDDAAQPTAADDDSADDQGDDDGDDASGTLDLDPCELLTDEDAEAALGAPIVEMRPEPEVPGTSVGCEWAADDNAMGQTVSFSVNVLVNSRDALDDTYGITGGEPETVPGLGDEANWFPDLQILRVQEGAYDVIVNVALLRLEAADSRERAIGAGEAAVPRLP
jgi:hypothetical protein